MNRAVLGTCMAAIAVKNSGRKAVFGHSDYARSKNEKEGSQARRWRTVSNKQTALATLTFRLSTAPAMGIRTS